MYLRRNTGSDVKRGGSALDLEMHWIAVLAALGWNSDDDIN
jgi:hypothetical protein